MKALKIGRAALTVLVIAFALALCAWVLASSGGGYAYDEMQRGLMYFLPVLAAIILLAAVLTVRARHLAPEKQKISRAQPYRENEMPARRKNALRTILICLAAVLIVLGITNGGLWDVLVKAINICTECIGLG